MRKFLLVVTVVGLSFCFAGVTQAQDTVQIFGGYSYLRPTVSLGTFSVCPIGILPPCPIVTLDTHPNLNGWEVAGTYNAYHWLGATADFSGDYGTDHGSSVHYQTYLFGPQVHLPGPVSPFAHVLIGVAHESIATGADIALPVSESAFAVAAGAGIDLQLAPFLSVRPIQLDYLVTRFASSTQNQVRASLGIVVHF
jgi:hypothetical protein